MNLIAGDKSVNKDYDSIPVAAYSSFPIPTDSLPTRSVSHKTNFMARDSNLLTQVIAIISTDKTSSFYTEIICLVEGNPQLEFNIANIREANTEFQPSESTNVTHESIVDIDKVLPRFLKNSILPQANKEIEENSLIRDDISQLQVKTITPKGIPEDPANNKVDMRVVTYPSVNAIFFGSKEIATPQANTPFNNNLFSHSSNILNSGGEEDKIVDVDITKSQNVIAPFTSFTISEDGNYFVSEDN